MNTYNHQKKLWNLLMIGLISLISHYTSAQTNSTISHDSSSMYVNHENESILDHLTEFDMSKLAIEANLENLFNDRRHKNYKQAVATFTFKDGYSWTDSLEVKVRGVYRAAKCDNPPLKIKYSKKLLKARGLKKRNEYKIVYPCKNNKTYQNYIYKEYLIYKLYNELTDKSLRVHLIDFTLQDATQKTETIQNTGFIIEHREEIIKRLNAVKNDLRCLPVDMLSPNDYTLFQVFQFMIGNVDWLIANCKNAEVVQMQDKTIIPIPYDFDYTGMVNPDYAKPSLKFKQKFVTDRYFIGQKKELEDLLPTLALFKKKKDTFINIINSFEQLPKKERKAMVKYLQSFYKILDRPSQVKDIFVHDMDDMKDRD